MLRSYSMSAFEALEKPSGTFSSMLPLVNDFKIALPRSDNQSFPRAKKNSSHDHFRMSLAGTISEILSVSREDRAI